MCQTGHLRPRIGHSRAQHSLLMLSVAGYKEPVLLASPAVKELFSVMKYWQPASHDARDLLAVLVVLAVLWECSGWKLDLNDERHEVSLQ